MTDAIEIQSAFAGIPVSSSGNGFAATAREGLGIACLSVRRGQREALQDRLSSCFELTLPDGARRVAARDIAAAGTGPGTWLLTREAGGNAFVSDLKSAVGGCASVVDQSDAYAILHLSGHRLRESLAKLVPVDLHPRAFKVGDVAATLAAQVGALLWRLEDGADGMPIFELAAPRSFAGSLWQSLSPHSP